MELGEKLRQARLEAGWTQRQLCGEEITRNMLSLIENGTAKPSMKTLGYLAGRLGKPVSYFLEETAVVSPNSRIMELARECHDREDAAGALAALQDYRGPDPVYDREAGLLGSLCRLTLAREALDSRRFPYARQLLEAVEPEGYCAEALRREKLLLLGRLGEMLVSSQLPTLDEELLLRAREAAELGHTQRAARLLEAMEDQGTVDWCLLRGDLYIGEENWKAAEALLTAIEEQAPRETAPRLEICCRELGDFQRAYYYACMQK